MITIRPATNADFAAIWLIFEAAIWLIFEAAVRGGDSFTWPPETSVAEARKAWMEAPEAVFVAEEDDRVLGSYFIKPNQTGLGNHVCNAAYMTAPEARGRGLAAKMCEHSQIEAKKRGYLAMQYNIVVSTNEPAVHLWQKMGFKIVGTLPKAFNHRKLGYVDAYVMHKSLVDEA